GCASVVDASISGVLRSRVYSLAAGAGDSYLIRLLQPSAATLFRPRVDIYDGTGAPVQFVNTSDLARQTFNAASDGTYTVVVTDSYDSSQSGSFTLSMLRLNRPCNAGTLSCGAPSPGNLARALDSGVYSYSAAEGESFSVRMLPTGGVQPAIEIYDQQGNRAGQSLTGTFTGMDVVNPAASAYTNVAVDHSMHPATGSFTRYVVPTMHC